MINRVQLLADLQAVLRKLEADLLERSEEMPEVSGTLTGEHQRARKADRTAQSYEDWRSDYITQIAQRGCSVVYSSAFWKTTA